jgi:hypothetical protein
MICEPCKEGTHCEDSGVSCFCQHRENAQLQTETPLLRVKVVQADKTGTKSKVGKPR